MRTKLNKTKLAKVRFPQKINQTPKVSLDKIKEQFGRESEMIMEADNKIWEEMGATHGGDIEKNWSEYLKKVDQRIKGDINPLNYKILEDQNYHSLNRALEELGKYSQPKKPMNQKIIDQYIKDYENGNLTISKGGNFQDFLNRLISHYQQNR